MKYSLFLVCLLALFSCKRTEISLSTTEQSATDDDKLREYLTKKNIKGYTRTVSGTYVVIDSAHPEERLIRNGNFAYVTYRGYLPDAETTAFDSNTDAGSAPFRVEIGRSGTVINGWQEGLRLMRNKEKGRLFIPSGQAYGSRGSGSIGANQILIFDIKVTKVE